MNSPAVGFDVCTVLSILPIVVHSQKPGLIPGDFLLPPVEDGDIYLLPVSRCHHPVYLDENRPSLLVPDPSDEVARSITLDYKESSLFYEEGVSEPGLSWVYGEYTNDDKNTFLEEHKALLSEVKLYQSNWFEALVKAADDIWAEHHRHNHVSDLSRIAAARLGFKDREWLVKEQVNKQLSRCQFCFTMVHEQATVCPSCHADLTMDTYRNVVTGGANAVAKIPLSQGSGSSPDQGNPGN